MPSNKEIEITLTLKDEATKKIKSFRSNVKEFSSATKDTFSPILQLRSAWIKVGLAAGAVIAAFTTGVQQVAKLHDEIQKLDTTSIKMGVSTEELSKKLYGFNIATESARSGSAQMKILLEQLNNVGMRSANLFAKAWHNWNVDLKTGYTAWSTGLYGNRQRLSEAQRADIYNKTKIAVKNEMKQDEKAYKEREAIRKGLVAETITKTNQLEMSGYEYKKYLLDQEVELYQLAGVDQVNLSKYVTEAKKRFDEDYTNEVKNRQAAILTAEGNTLEALRIKQDVALTEYKRQWGESGEAVQAFKRGQQEQYKQAQLTYLGIKSNFQIMRDGFLGVVNSMTTSLSGFYDTATGEFKSLKEVASSFGRTVIGIINQMIAQYIIAKAVMGISNLVGSIGVQSDVTNINNMIYGTSYHRGGPIRAHSGLYVGSGLAADEVPIVAKRGEYVVSENGVSTFGKNNLDRVNRGEGVAGESHIHYHSTVVIKAWDFADIYSNKTTIENIINESLRRQGTVAKSIKRYS